MSRRSGVVEWTRKEVSPRGWDSEFTFDLIDLIDLITVEGLWRFQAREWGDYYVLAR